MFEMLSGLPFTTDATTAMPSNLAALRAWSGCSGAYCTAMCAGGCGLICVISVAGVAIAAGVSLIEGNAGNNLVTP